MKEINVRPDAATGTTTAKSNSKTFSPFIDAKGQAYDLVSRCIHNTMKGRVAGEIIPYYYCAVCYDGSYGLGISFHYDLKRGLRWEIYTVDKDLSGAVKELFAEWGELDKAKEYFYNEYSEYMNYVNEVKQWVDCYMECGDDKYCWDEICEAVEKYQITEEEAKEKTNWLYNEGSYMYV